MTPGDTLTGKTPSYNSPDPGDRALAPLEPPHPKSLFSVLNMDSHMPVGSSSIKYALFLSPQYPGEFEDISIGSRLPDTGQIANYTDTFGEDSDYTINPPSYEDNNDGTITDNVTGLVWQKTDGGSMAWEDAIAYADLLSLGGAPRLAAANK